MLKITDQENLIMMFFVVTLLILSIYAVTFRNLIDIIYLCVILYYFVKFLVVRFKKC